MKRTKTFFTDCSSKTPMGKRKSRSGGSSRRISTFPSEDLTTAGARRAVWEGRARKTRGGLTRDDLTVSKSTGKIVSKRASRASRRNFERNGLRPDKNIAYKNIAYKGAAYRVARKGGEEEDGEVMSAETFDWDQLLADA